MLKSIVADFRLPLHRNSPWHAESMSDSSAEISEAAGLNERLLPQHQPTPCCYVLPEDRQITDHIATLIYTCLLGLMVLVAFVRSFDSSPASPIARTIYDTLVDSAGTPF